MQARLTSQGYFALWFLLTGIFALVGGLFTWGRGPVYQETDLLAKLIPMADLFAAAPLSVLTAIGLWRQKKWAIPVGLFCAGTFFMGSIVVFVLVSDVKAPYPAIVALPAVMGWLFSLLFAWWGVREILARS